jgi:hypothetical protein
MFAKDTNNERQGKRRSSTAIRRGLTALALVGSLGAIALATPVAASASTVTLGPYNISENGDLREYPSNGHLYASGPLAGCEVWVGDHFRSDSLAAGEGLIWCNTPHSFVIKVYLDYRTSLSGPLTTWISATNSWSTKTGGVWGGTYTGPACTAGLPMERYWTTETEISVDGSAWQGWFTSAVNSMYPLYHC